MSAKPGNKYAIGNNGGRPAKYSLPKQLAKKVDEYFVFVKGEFHFIKEGEKDTVIWDRRPEPATITGLTLFLGFSSRASLDDYEKKEEYSYIIKRARTMVEHEYEKRLSSDKPTGSIFALKNMGWRDKQTFGFDWESANNEQLDYIIEQLKNQIS